MHGPGCIIPQCVLHEWVSNGHVGRATKATVMVTWPSLSLPMYICHVCNAQLKKRSWPLAWRTQLVVRRLSLRSVGHLGKAYLFLITTTISGSAQISHCGPLHSINRTEASHQVDPRPGREVAMVTRAIPARRLPLLLELACSRMPTPSRLLGLISPVLLCPALPCQPASLPVSALSGASACLLCFVLAAGSC